MGDIQKDQEVLRQLAAVTKNQDFRACLNVMLLTVEIKLCPSKLPDDKCVYKKVFLGEGRNLVHTSAQTQMTTPGSAGTNVPGGHNQRVLLCTSGKLESSRGQCGANQCFHDHSS